MSRSVGIGTIEQDDGDGHLKRQIMGREVVVAATDVSRIVPTREQMSGVLEKLRGADRRSIGRAAELIADVLNDPTLFGVVFNGMQSDDPIVRMRLADVVEKITAEHPEYLQSYKTVLVEKVADIEQQEVRWHVAQMIPRLGLSGEELNRVHEIVRGYLSHKSKIVKTSSMQPLADLVEQDITLLPEVIELLEEQTRTGSPAMKSRGRKLLATLRSKHNRASSQVADSVSDL